MAEQWDDWAARSDVEPWSDDYDDNLKGRARQIRGGADTPQLPGVMMDGR